MPDSYILSRMDAEGVSEEEANYRTWIDLHEPKLGIRDAVAAAKEMLARGEFLGTGLPAPERPYEFEDD